MGALKQGRVGGKYGHSGCGCVCEGGVVWIVVHHRVSVRHHNEHGLDFPREAHTASLDDVLA